MSRTSTSPSRARRSSAPLGIKLVCVLGAVGAVVGLFGGLVGLGAGGAAFVIGTFAIGLSAAQLVVVWGLWTLQSWAWTLALLFFGFDLLVDLVGGNVLGALVAGVILVYVFSQGHRYGR